MESWRSQDGVKMVAHFVRSKFQKGVSSDFGIWTLSSTWWIWLRLTSSYWSKGWLIETLLYVVLKKFKKLRLLKLSSLEIDKIKTNFDLIICGFFLYLLDREEIFNQFNLIYKKLNQNGYLIIQDYNPLFKHTNISRHNRNLKSFKMNYDNFLVESGLFKMIYKVEKLYPLKRQNIKIKYKSTEEAISLYKKINFSDSYPENL